MNIDDIFARGLHNLDNAALLKLADSQQVLLNTSHSNLVYLVQEMSSRIEDLADHRAVVLREEDHGTEYNG